jgi:hypothetical protein
MEIPDAWKPPEIFSYSKLIQTGQAENQGKKSSGKSFQISSAVFIAQTTPIIRTNLAS